MMQAGRLAGVLQRFLAARLRCACVHARACARSFLPLPPPLHPLPPCPLTPLPPCPLTPLPPYPLTPLPPCPRPPACPACPACPPPPCLPACRSLQHETHYFIFAVAVTHIVYCSITIALTLRKVRASLPPSLPGHTAGAGPEGRERQRPADCNAHSTTACAAPAAALHAWPMRPSRVNDPMASAS
jgi:hypothetical protein